MKNIFFLLAASTILACAPGGSSSDTSNGGNSTQSPFSGTPKNFNGDWRGTGDIVGEGQKYENLIYKINISKTPQGVDVSYNIVDRDETPYLVGSMTGHYVSGNSIYDIRDKVNVGSIGGKGFFLERKDKGRFEVTQTSEDSLILKGFMSLGSQSKLNFSSIIYKIK